MFKAPSFIHHQEYQCTCHYPKLSFMSHLSIFGFPHARLIVDRYKLLLLTGCAAAAAAAATCNSHDHHPVTLHGMISVDEIIITNLQCMITHP